MNAEDEALTSALEACEGLPVPSYRQFAERVKNQLAARGYEITRTRTPRGDLRITGYPCTCETGRGCLEHPFLVMPRETGP